MDFLKEKSVPVECTSHSKTDERPSSPNDCAICLEQLTDKSFTNSCLHMFCFHCLLAWSKVKPECPLCKQDFCSIIHNIRSMTDYDEYHVPPTEAGLQMTPPYLSNNRTTDDYFRQSHDLFSSHRRFFSYRTTVMSNGLNIPRERSPNLVITPYVDNLELQNDFSRLNSSSSLFSRSNRREIYLKELETHPPSPGGRYRECSPEFYRENEGQLHRLGRWLHRELIVLSQIGVLFIQHELQHLIMDMLRVYNINSDVFRNVLNRYLGVHTNRFIREFYNFATSPFEMDQYDRECVYVRQRNGSHLSFIVTVGRDDSEDVQVIPNNSLDPPVQPWIDVNDLNSRTYHVSGSGFQISARLHRNTCPHDRFSASNNPAVQSHSVINISDSENDDCVIIEEVKTKPETIVLDDSDYEHQNNSRTSSTRHTLRSNNALEHNNVPLDLSRPRSSWVASESFSNISNNPETSQSSNSVVSSTAGFLESEKNQPKRKGNIKPTVPKLNKIKFRKRSSCSSSSILSTDISSDENEQNNKSKRKKYKRLCKSKNSKKCITSSKYYKRFSGDDYDSVSAQNSNVENDKNDLDWEESYHKRKKKLKKLHNDKHERKCSPKKRKKSTLGRKSQRKKRSVSTSDSSDYSNNDIKYEKRKKKYKKSDAVSNGNVSVKTTPVECDTYEVIHRSTGPKLRSIVKKVKNTSSNEIKRCPNYFNSRTSYELENVNDLPSTSYGYNGHNENRFHSMNFFRNAYSSDSD